MFKIALYGEGGPGKGALSACLIRFLPFVQNGLGETVNGFEASGGQGGTGFSHLGFKADELGVIARTALKQLVALAHGAFELSGKAAKARVEANDQPVKKAAAFRGGPREQAVQCRGQPDNLHEVAKLAASLDGMAINFDGSSGGDLPVGRVFKTGADGGGAIRALQMGCNRPAARAIETSQIGKWCATQAAPWREQ